jgi:serpin B
VVHQAFVAVDEDGTEAAAATAVVLSDSGSATAPPEKVIDVTFDRPFVFFIRDNATGAILFLGRVARP